MISPFPCDQGLALQGGHGIGRLFGVENFLLLLEKGPLVLVEGVQGLLAPGELGLLVVVVGERVLWG